MNQEELLKQLQELHKELSAADEADADTRAALHQITTDIDRLLNDADNPSAASEAAESSTLGERLRDMARQFDVRYPHIADLIERVSDGLASMGI